MNTVCSYYIPQVEEQLLTATFPDFSGTVSTSIGTLEYSISDLLISSIDFGVSDINIDKEAEVYSLALSNSSLQMQFSYAVTLLSWPYTSDAGSGVLTADGVDIDFSLRAGKNETNGAFSFYDYHATLAIRDFRLDLSGGIVAAILTVLEDLFAAEINGVVCAALEELMQDFLDDIFGPIDTDSLMHCCDDVCQDNRLSADLLPFDTYVAVEFGGTYYDGPDQSDYTAPTDFTALPTSINDQMLSVIYGPPSFSTFFRTLVHTELLADAAAAPDDAAALNADLPVLLAADALADSFPEFAAAYPGEAARVDLRVLDLPASSIFYSAVQVVFSLAVDVSPASAAAASEPAASFAVDLTTSATLEFAGHTAADEPIAPEKYLLFAFEPYATDASVAACALDSVALTDALTAWLGDVALLAAVQGAWQPVWDGYGLVFPQMDFLYANRRFVYSPEYVAVSLDYLLAE
eukprot:gnl/Chilomastix_cuspidata/1868.p1 GENE.gnl/Chilomastix_cuspidata/1868~~gnl/Chilomastix_cuspidata/1868.p1  ORF type:complete len:526 (-),score=253.35 gnl/Chilomastix_cuspidata/1868:89-1480(-)